MSAAIAVPPASSGTGVVILPDVRGLFGFYIELAERFADAGYPAVALDYYSRTAGPGVRDAAFDFWPHLLRTSTRRVQEDIAVGVEALSQGVPLRSIVTVGFCFGGMQSLLAGASDTLALAGEVGVYPILDGYFGTQGPVDVAAEIRGPVLGLFAGADEKIPAGRVRDLGSALATAGVAHETHIYPGAPHSFFDDGRDAHEAESADVWRRILAFLHRLTAERGAS
jgi:carboxymethylenebutenolidase